MKYSSLTINGDNNEIVIGDNCTIGQGTDILIEGNNHCLIISRNSTFTQYIHFCLQENNTKITLGDDCMLSNHIIIRTSDSHPIYNRNGEHVNHAKNIIIGNHVWICPHSTIMKGCSIGDGAIIASNAMVTNNVPAKSMVAGVPSKVIKEDVMWTREALW